MKLSNVTKLVGVVAIALVMGGCAKYDVVPPELAVLQSEPIDGYTCKGGCATEWSKTQIWINRHSKMKIQLANDTIIETYNQTEGYGLNFSATKEPIGNGLSRIQLAVARYNGNTEKTALYTKKAFYYYLKTGKDLLSPVPSAMFFSILIN